MTAYGKLLLCGWQYERSVDFDLDLVADQNAAGFQCSVPGDAEFLAGDGGRSEEANAGCAECVYCLAAEFCVEFNFLGHAADGQVANENELARVALDGGGLEGHGWELLGVEEVFTLQVAVAIGVLGVDRCDLDGCFNRGVSQGLAGGQGCVELGERA